MAVFKKSYLEEYMPLSALAAPIAKNSKPSKKSRQSEILQKMSEFWNLKDSINIFKGLILFYKPEGKTSTLNATKCWIKFI